MEMDRIPDHAQRYHRFPAALEPAYFKVDERSEAELIAFAVELAALLEFRDLESPVEGASGQNWIALFKGDVSFLLATMCTVDTRREFYESIEPESRQRRRGDGPPVDMLGRIILAALRIDRWYEQVLDAQFRSGGASVEESLRATLETAIIERLAPLLVTDDDLRKEWFKQSVNDIWTIAGDPRFTLHGTQEQGLSDIYNEFNRATAQIVSLARDYLTQSLHEKTDHPAHGALYLAFVSLLIQSQEHINTLTERHLDFYYRQVLRLAPRREAPDTARVTFQLAPGVEEYALKEGTLLLAGKDHEGEDIHYRVDEDELLNRADIVSLKSLALPPDPDIDAAILGYEPVAGVFANPVADSADGQGMALEHPERGWPTFGESRPESRGGAAEHGPGLLIASPVLRLAGGHRRLRIAIRFTGGAGSLASAMSAYEQGIQSKYEGRLRRRTFMRMLSDAFRVSYSTTEGFHEVDEIRLDVDPDDPGAIVLSLRIDAGQPALAPDAAFAREAGLASRRPLIRLALNTGARAFPYSFLAGLEIERVAIRVEVRDLPARDLHNDLGPVDSSSAFAPFGPMPARGAELLIGADELRGKALDRLRLRVDWANLPEPPEDLASHYSAYGMNTANDSFRGSLGVLTGSGWITPTPHQGARESDRDATFPLFTTGAADRSVLSRRVCWAFDLDGTRIATGDSQARPVSCLRLALVDPAYGFGASLYRQRLVDTVAANARLKKVKAHKPLPKEPFVPEVRRIWIDYRASEEIFPGRAIDDGDDHGGDDAGAIYHAHPFGGISEARRGAAMVPAYRERGYLFIGLVGVEPGRTLTLLFHMRESIADKWTDDRGSRRAKDRRRIRWGYLSNDRWLDLDRDDLIADGTLEFTRSGIVKLRVPRDITPSTNLMERGRYWLRIGAARDTKRYGRMIGVHTQAVTATRVTAAVGDVRPPGIPAGTITALAVPAAEVSSVSQPFPSRGGRDAETTDAFRVRVSERLRHKQRAIHPGDYESLVMEAFPEVREAKAFNHGPGRVVVVVVPTGSGGTPEAEPRVAEYVLGLIAEYLRGYSSPFVEEICVRNPWYEPLEVTGWVKFAASESEDSLPVLERALEIFISPWRSDPSVPMDIGTGVMDLPKLRAFIERQPYVHQLTGLSIVHTYKTEHGELVRHRLRDSSRSESGYSVFRSSSPWSVLASAPRHGLNVLREHAGIGDLEIAGDFVVTSPDDVERLTEGRLHFPRRPARAGIGNLAIGGDFIMTTDENAVPDA